MLEKSNFAFQGRIERGLRLETCVGEVARGARRLIVVRCVLRPSAVKIETRGTGLRASRASRKMELPVSCMTLCQQPTETPVPQYIALSHDETKVVTQLNKSKGVVKGIQIFVCLGQDSGGHSSLTAWKYRRSFSCYLDEVLEIGIFL